MNVILEMFFFSFSNISIQFDIKSFNYKTYIITKTLPIARLIKLIDKYKFAKTALDKNSETFIIYIVALESLKPAIPSS